jgi:uncharacterized membrane protein YfhO
MKKQYRDRYVWILIIGSIALCWLFVCRWGVFGSQVDWISQHSVLPDYFRKHFYETGSLFPDVAWNLGGGQNIYNFAYYGIYSPVILLSFLLPFVRMDNYIMAGSIAGYAVSAALFYRWLMNKKIARGNGFLVAVMFALAAPLLFHSHNQLMFVNYMPFLCLAFMGCDRYFEKKKRGLLIFSVTAMILTSFYFSIGGMAALCLYVLGEYVIKGKIRQGLSFLGNLFLSIALSGFLLVPAAAAIVQGRGESSTGSGIALFSIHPIRFLYSPYGLGLTAFAVICLLAGVLCGGRWQKRLIPAGLLVVLTVPVFACLLNGGLYEKDKVFIPFLPLVCLMAAYYLERERADRDFSRHHMLLRFLPYLSMIFLVVLLKNDTTFHKYWIYALADAVLMLLLYAVYLRFPGFPWQVLASCVILLFCGQSVNMQPDTVITKTEYDAITDETKAEAVTGILDGDNGLYRMDQVGNGSENKANINRIFDIRQNLTSVYSSASNQNYNNFRTGIFELNEPFRNNMMQSPTDNPCFLQFMGVKYLMGKSAPDGYQLYKEYENYNIYKNDSTAPLIYASSQVIGENEYSKMTFPDNQTTLLQRVVVPEQVQPEQAQSDTPEQKLSTMLACEFSIPETDTGDITITKLMNADGTYSYEIKAKKEVKIEAGLSGLAGEDTLLALSFDVENEKPSSDMHIRLQEQTNRMSAAQHTYANHNEKFTYMVTVGEDKTAISMKFGKGKYILSNLQSFSGNIGQIQNDELYEQAFEPEETGRYDDPITGAIESAEDGYLITSIPYDDNFTIQVDGEEVKLLKVNTAFLGAKLPKGEHSISISYQAPGKFAGLVLSAAAVVILAAGCIGKYRKKDKNKMKKFEKYPPGWLAQADKSSYYKTCK